MNSNPFLKSRKLHVAVLLTGLLLNAATAQATPSNDKKSKLVIYDDLSTFAAAIAEIDAGSAPTAAFQQYIDKASPGSRYLLRDSAQVQQRLQKNLRNTQSIITI